MQENWSLMLNVFLLVVVITAIVRMLYTKRNVVEKKKYEPASSVAVAPNSHFDDIIAVRKVDRPLPFDPRPSLQPTLKPSTASLYNDQLGSAVSKNAVLDAAQHIDTFVPTLYHEANKARLRGESTSPNGVALPEDSASPIQGHFDKTAQPASVMMFLLAKTNRQFAGYELLQTLLAAGLRFGDGQLFHRHQQANGQGPVICSLAAATEAGTFDLQTMGAFSVRGLCLFMAVSGSPPIDAERLSIMLDTARQLSEGLDAHLLDSQRQPLTDEAVEHYYRLLHVHEEERCHETH